MTTITQNTKTKMKTYKQILNNDNARTPITKQISTNCLQSP